MQNSLGAIFDKIPCTIVQSVLEKFLKLKNPILNCYFKSCSLPTINITSASSGPARAFLRSSTSLSSLVYFSLTGSNNGLGGLRRERKQKQYIIKPHLHLKSHLLIPMGSHVPLLLIFLVALPFFVAISNSVKQAVSSIRSCALDRF